MNVRTVTEAKKVERLRQEMARKDERALRFILEEERGRWFYMRMLERCGCLSRVLPKELQDLAALAAQQQIGDGLDKNVRQLYENAASQEQADYVIGLRRMAEDEYLQFKRRFKHLEEERE